ncbi:ComEC/Rec2 family competence protein [Marinifilum caeruleilacunae]|uniref:ComEC family competence protein n=1 Tax=Marinifilum caeruleilacunae TaxID=2499076 RepID=A0ABX1WZ90_9BACT|nr:ComEC/Rec2 family competence protein [Marinifilum caeruleilacunae]NOU61175.1 ComEC family competence protein [Marinifilum caeruleilacunae]
MDFKELLRQHPFLRILLPLIFGILATESFDLSIGFVQIVLISGLLLNMAFVVIGRIRRSRELRLLHGMLVFLIIANLAAFRVQTVKKEMYITSTDENRNYLLELSENPNEKTKFYSCLAKIRSSIYNDVQRKETANVILYFRKDSLVKGLKTGDRILVDSKLNRVKNAGNPNEFDYAAYLKNRHVLYASYVESNKWIKKDGHAHWNLKAMAWQWRDQLLQIYREQGIKDEAFDILAALTLGYKAGLDPEVKKAWGDAGAMHVLAVSGLHVGIIYLVTSFILSFLLKIRYGRWFRALLLLTVLCMYALLTGLSPSVLRATCMFAFIVIGESMRRKGGIFNSLAASAFFLLLHDPYLIYSVGFQFSYLAVAGIVLLQPRFDRLILIQNTILNKFWQLTTVGLSAQIATFPLSIYYFNQFPSYFLLSGYVVILMAGILIYLSALLLFLSKIDFISHLLAWILQTSVELLHQIMIWIHNLPGAVVRNLFYSFYDVILLYLIICAVIFILIVKRKKAVFALIVLLIVYQIPNAIQNFQSEKKEIIVFNAGKNSLIALRQARNVFYLNDQKMDPIKKEFLSHNYSIKNRLYTIDSDTIREIDFRRFNHKGILIIGKNKCITEELLTTLKPDIVLLRKSGLKDYQILTKHTAVCSIVADGSVYNKDMKRLHEHEPESMAKLFVIKDRGAFRIDLSTEK